MSLSTTEAQPLGLQPDIRMRYGLMITGAQIRAARALLGWSASDLAEKSGVSHSSIQRAEAIDGISTMRATNLFALQRALEDGGVIFIGAGDNRSGGDGVRLRPR